MKKIHYGRHFIDDEDIESVVNTLRSDALTQGPQVPLFEKSICDYVGVKYAVAVNSATSALHLACLALDVSPGDLVWTSSITFVASANCALYCGAKIDFVDIDIDTFNISIANLEEKLINAEKSGTLPKVLIVVHLAGSPCEMQAIKLLSDKYNFYVIEDASHAIGAVYLNSHIGSCAYSDITIFSFHPVKIITTGEGGMALTNNYVYARKMQLLRTHGISGEPNELIARPDNEIWNYQQISLGFNYRMTDIAASFGISQLKKINCFNEERKQIAKNYDKKLADLDLILPKQSVNSESSWHLYIIRLKDCNNSKKQKSVYTFMREKGIFVNLHYIPVYRHPYYEKLGFKYGYCPNAEIYYQSAMSIPIYIGLTDVEQNLVVSSFKHVLNK